MPNEITVVDVQGSAYECGKAYGEAVPILIKRNIDIYSKLYRFYSNINKEEAIEYALQFEDSIRKYCPVILDEMHGIADGAKVAFEEILMINLRTELLAFGQHGARECTVLAGTYPATSNSEVWIAQNWDWLYSTNGTAILYKVKQVDFPAIIMYVEAGHVGKLGLNDAGIGLCHNWLDSGHHKHGIPFIVLCRLILNMKEIKDAIDIIYGVERASSGNFLLAHKNGFVINLETSPGDVAFLEPDQGILVHTNHFVSERLRGSDIGLQKKGGDSLVRSQIAVNKLRKAKGKIGKKILIDLLKDRSCGNYSICTLPSNSEPEFARWGSLASIIINLNKLDIFIAHGFPHETSYKKFHF